MPDLTRAEINAVLVEIRALANRCISTSLAHAADDVAGEAIGTPGDANQVLGPNRERVAGMAPPPPSTPAPPEVCHLRRDTSTPARAAWWDAVDRAAANAPTLRYDEAKPPEGGVDTWALRDAAVWFDKGTRLRPDSDLLRAAAAELDALRERVAKSKGRCHCNCGKCLAADEANALRERERTLREALERVAAVNVEALSWLYKDQGWVPNTTDPKGEAVAAAVSAVLAARAALTASKESNDASNNS